MFGIHQKEPHVYQEFLRYQKEQSRIAHSQWLIENEGETYQILSVSINLDSVSNLIHQVVPFFISEF